MMIVQLLTVITAMSGAPAVIHVPADQPTIQAAVDAAADGDTVEVADGTYTGPGNRDVDLLGKAITVRSAGLSRPACSLPRRRGR